MTMPAQKPGKSKQDYSTPQELIDAIERRLGPFQFDLAASYLNTKAPRFISLDKEEDSLKVDWPIGELCWLNPPFADIEPWVKKCRITSELGSKIVMLAPASVGSNWFAEEVWGHAGVVALRPRITFEGCKDPYPKDCMLLLWGIGWPSFGFGLWKWR